MAYSKKKNLISNRSEYNKYYGNFRGVDFSSDHTQVAEQRFAYSVNMYKDYKSEQGDAVETIPGFQELFTMTEGKVSDIRGIHPFEFKYNGSDYTIFFIQCYHSLYYWIPEDKGGATKIDGITLSDYSESFVFNNRLHIISAGHHYCFDPSKLTDKEVDSEGNTTKVVDISSGFASAEPYIPTTYINIRPGQDIGVEYEQLNFLTPAFKNTFIADGTTKDYYLINKVADGTTKDDITVSVYGSEITDFSLKENCISFTNAPTKPSDAPGGYEGQAGVVITVKPNSGDRSDRITLCDIYAIHDNRLFLSGNREYPNRVFFCGMHDGFYDPSYFPETYYFDVGVSNMSRVTGMMSVADSLMILKSDSVQDGTVWYYKGVLTEDDLYPVRYEGTRGLAGLGCLGACTNFLDDPVFISRLGVEAVGQLSVRLERAIEHRSSLIDAKLVSSDLSQACLEEWEGYLVLLTQGGKIFLADSRQRYTHPSGVMQYEWYYLEDIGVYEGQYHKYTYATEDYGLTNDNVTITEDGTSIQVSLADETLRGTAANDNTKNTVKEATVSVQIAGAEGSKTIDIAYIVKDGQKILCVTNGEYIGGEFCPATYIKAYNGNLFFGTSKGHFCKFNFDMREEDGTMPKSAYAFNGRTIKCGVATKMDNCGIPHLTKSTVKRSTVIKTKSFKSSAAKIKVRTNNEPYKQIDRINSGLFDFSDIDFSDFTFITTPESLFAISEKEKRWVEKQYYIYSDEYLKPFSLHYIAYRYNISGRFK